MAPSPERIGALMPSHSPCQDEQVRGEQPPSVQTMAVNSTSQVREPARLVCGISFYLPVCPAANICATALLTKYEATSREIAAAISSRQLTNYSQAVVHLASHLDHLAGATCVLKYLAKHLNKVRWPGTSCHAVVTKECMTGVRPYLARNSTSSSVHDTQCCGSLASSQCQQPLPPTHNNIRGGLTKG
jgi:hypothetical protein